jgi:hypothetical protein
MNTLATKLTAFAASVTMNALIMAGVVYMFALQAHPHLSVFA